MCCKGTSSCYYRNMSTNFWWNCYSKSCLNSSPVAVFWSWLYDYLTDESVVDPREFNASKAASLTFWQHFEKVLQEYCADNQRHGDVHLPVAMSIPDVKRKVLEKMFPDTQCNAVIPSDEYISSSVLAGQQTFTLPCQIYWEIQSPI